MLTTACIQYKNKRVEAKREEMEVEREWRAVEEEEEEEVEELEIRLRRKGKMGIENEEDRVHGEDKSVYFDEDKGVWKCRHCTWTYHLHGPAIDHIQKHEGNCQMVMMDVENLTLRQTFIESPIEGGEVKDFTFRVNSIEVNQLVAEDNSQIGKSSNGTKEFTDHESHYVRNSVIENRSTLHQNSEKKYQNGNGNGNGNGKFDNGTTKYIDREDQFVRNSLTENGSNSHQSSENKYQNGVTKIENEIKEYEELKSKNYDPELVERVVEEQDTHDFFCPNCHSCITKRVILRRKRKRVARGPRESQPELPPEKIPHIEGQEGRLTPTEIPDQEDETVFRCLSCFSIFIPTEGGFNIFPFFGKRDGSKNLQSPEKTPTKNLSWFSTLFGSNSSKKESSQAVVVPLLSEVTGDQSSREESSPPLSISVATGVAQNEAAIEVNNADLNTDETYFDPSAEESYATGGLKGGQAEGTKQDMSEGSSTKELYGYGRLEGNHAHESKYPTATVSEVTDTSKPDFTGQPPILVGISQINQNIINSLPPSDCLPQDYGKNINVPSLINPTLSATVTTSGINQNVQSQLPNAAVEARIDVGSEGARESGRDLGWDILKSIVYGGLIESITSLSVVSSAAGAGSSTLNICALGLANLIGGLVMIVHNLSELKRAHDSNATDRRDRRTGRYWEQLGKREHFRHHVVFAILSYIIFGLLSPVVYGFTFRKSDNKEHKLIAVAASSILGVALLAIGKAHVRTQRDYIKSLFHYLTLSISASGLSYVAGVMINRILVELGLFDPSSSPSPPSIDMFRLGSESPAWASL